MRKPAAEQPAVALRSALQSPWPEFRAAARRVIRKAIRMAPTLGEAAEKLGVGRRTLERIREEFPSVFSVRKKSS